MNFTGSAARGIGVVIAIILTAVMSLVGCRDRGNAYVPPPPPEVTVAKPVLRVVTRYLEYTGTTTGVETVELRARVRGFLEKVHFIPGTQVKQNDLLFTIDQRTFQVAVAAAEADVAGKKAAADITEIQYQKAVGLLAKQASTQLEVDEWKAKRDQAFAAVDYARSVLDAAKLDLEFTEVRSPVAGMVGVNLVDVGTLVGVSEPTLLTTVIRQDQVYAYLDVSERDVLDITSARVAEGKMARERGVIPLELGMANEQGYPHIGMVNFADNTVSPQTGTLRVRGVFDNPRNLLLPGLYVRLRAPRDTVSRLLLPDAAVQQDQGGRYVLVVNDRNEVERRSVVVNKAIGQIRPIESGLDPEDHVIIAGILRTRPGGKVAPNLKEIDSALLPPQAQESRDVLIPTPTVPTTAPAAAPAVPN